MYDYDAKEKTVVFVTIKRTHIAEKEGFNGSVALPPGVNLR